MYKSPHHLNPLIFSQLSTRLHLITHCCILSHLVSMPSHLSVHDHLCHCSLEAGELRRLKISQDVALLNVENLPQHGQVVVLESRRPMVEHCLLILDPVVIEVVHSIVVQVVTKRCDQQGTDLQVAE